MMDAKCEACPHGCVLKEGQTGYCRTRTNRNGIIESDSYGAVTSLMLDPIEKKPLRRFRPGSRILSVGSFGCSMRCPFCQNAEISQRGAADSGFMKITPDELAEKAGQLVPYGNIGIAYTYNEPLTFWEFVRDTAEEVHRRGMVNVMVSNGMAADRVLDALLPLVDAWNIDLKTFDPVRYRNWGGDLEAVLHTIRRAHGSAHVELTTLLIPGENDTEEETERIAACIAGISPEIPLHLSRFFPCYRMTDREPLPVEKIYMLAACARKYLRYVYTGNC